MKSDVHSHGFDVFVPSAWEREGRGTLVTEIVGVDFDKMSLVRVCVAAVFSHYRRYPRE